MGDAAAGMAGAAAVAGGSSGVPPGIVALLAAGASRRLAVLSEGGPHTWAALVLLFWVVWLCMQAPWRVLGLALRRDRAAAPAAAARQPWRRDPTVLMLRTFAYGAASALLWMAHLDPEEFKSWEDVYFFCGDAYQNCTAGFRWNGGGWLQAFVLWNFVLSSALLLQKFVVALGLGGLLPGEEVVTRESFVSIAWRLVPYWLNQWEQQWGAECSSMLFELPHFALELLVVLPCVQIFCGRLRVMAQPHIRDPLPAPANGGIEAPEAAEAAAEGAAAERPAGEAAAGAADQQQAGQQQPGQQQQRQDCWVPDVMRCRWRRDPEQRRLLPRLRANLRAMALSALIIGVAASNSLLVPLALEARPAHSQRANQMLRFKKELAFLVTTGRHADTALWYQRLAAASAHDEHSAETISGDGSGGNGSSEASAQGHAAPAPAQVPTPAFGMTGSRGRGGEGAAGFLAAVLEGSSNSSRLDAKLAVWSTLWQPLLPPHWLRAVLAADASHVAGLNPAYLSALQFVEHAGSAELAKQLHAAANNPRACSEAQAMLQRLLPHSGEAQAGSQLADMLEFNTAGREATVRLLLMGAMVGGIDAKSAPLRLKPSAAGAAGSAGLDAATLADLEWLRTQQAIYAAKAELPAGLLLADGGHGSSSGPQAPAAGQSGSNDGSSSSAGNTTGVQSLHLSWQQQQRMAPLYRLLHKHCTELERMRSTDHRHLIPLVELSLAIMRLSCERFFSLLAVFLGFLAFRDPPPAVQRIIRVISAFASVFQRLVLYSFPAICWAYGAGALFSSFVSVVFWTGPLVRTVERLRSAAVSVQPRQWHHATHEEVERMGRQCAICWGDMTVRISRHARQAAGGEAAEQQLPGQAGGAAAPGGAADEATAAEAAAASAAQPPPAATPGAGAAEPEGGSGPNAGLSAHGARSMALPCGHAFHRECLQQWLQQCYGQGRGATCPMCQATIPLRVRYRLPFSHHRRRRQEGAAAADGDPQAAEQQQEEGAAAAAAAAEGIPGLAALVAQLQDDFRARFEPMLDMPAELGAEDEAQWPPPEAVLLPPHWPEGDLLERLAAVAAAEAAEAAAAAVAAAMAVQAPLGQAANVIEGAAPEAAGEIEAQEAAAAAVLQQVIDAVDAQDLLLHTPAHQPAQEPQPAPQAQPAQQAQQAQQQPVQARPVAQQQRPGFLFGRLLRRRRGNG